MKKLTALVLVSLLLFSMTVTVLAATYRVEEFAFITLGALGEMLGDPDEVQECDPSDYLFLIGYALYSSEYPDGYSGLYVGWDGFIYLWIQPTAIIMGVTLGIQNQLDKATVTHGFVQIIDISKI